MNKNSTNTHDIPSGYEVAPQKTFLGIKTIIGIILIAIVGIGIIATYSALEDESYKVQQAQKRFDKSLLHLQKEESEAWEARFEHQMNEVELIQSKIAEQQKWLKQNDGRYSAAELQRLNTRYDEENQELIMMKNQNTEFSAHSGIIETAQASTRADYLHEQEQQASAPVDEGTITEEQRLKRNEEELSKLNADMKWRAEIFLKAATLDGYNLMVTDGLRTDSEQKALYAKGRTSGGKIVTYKPDCTTDPSRHCTGEAIDVVNIYNQKLDYNNTDYTHLKEIGKQYNLCWGGEFEGFPDKPHYELCLDEPEDPMISKINTYIANYKRANHELVDGSGYLWVQYAKEFAVKPEVGVCIAVADTGLGDDLKSKNNLTNHGNTGSGATVDFASIDDNIKATYDNLGNDYYNSTTVKELDYSCSGIKPYYAHSLNCNWSNNVTACIRKLTGDNSITNNYRYKSE